MSSVNLIVYFAFNGKVCSGPVDAAHESYLKIGGSWNGKLMARSQCYLTEEQCKNAPCGVIEPSVPASIAKDEIEDLLEKAKNSSFVVLPSELKLGVDNISGQKYMREPVGLKDGKMDVYAALATFDVKCPATAHAIKKLLCAGLRGKGDRQQDLRESIDAILRAIELDAEVSP